MSSIKILALAALVFAIVIFVLFLVHVFSLDATLACLLFDIAAYTPAKDVAA